MRAIPLHLAQVDPASDRAAFRQVADQLRDANANGQLGENERIPSETRPRGRYGAAWMTADTPPA
jgi:GntR family transcriptional regulator